MEPDVEDQEGFDAQEMVPAKTMSLSVCNGSQQRGNRGRTGNSKAR